MAGDQGFSAHQSDGVYVPGAFAVVFDVVDFVLGSGFNTATSIYTAPVSGYYLFSTTMRNNNAGGPINVFMNINGRDVG